MKATWDEAVAQAEHRVAIGLQEVYLDSDEGIDWGYCDDVTEGGSHRLDISTSVVFHFTHPSGLTMRWHFDLEKRGSNGQGYYLLDVEGIGRLLGSLPVSTRAKFAAMLAADADKVTVKADEFLDYAKRQYGEAAALRRLATPEETR